MHASRAREPHPAPRLRAPRVSSYAGRLACLGVGAATWIAQPALAAPSAPTLVAVDEEPAGANCSAGGVRVDSGPDDDGSGTLEATEIEETLYVCDGEDGADGADGRPGATALVEVVSEPPGEKCRAGGYKVLLGWDSDADGVLVSSEVDEVLYVCNGEGGVAGSDGEDGEPYAGDDPPAGTASRVRTLALPVGHPACPQGGTMIEVGADLDQDERLEPHEVQRREVVCNGAPWTEEADLAAAGVQSCAAAGHAPSWVGSFLGLLLLGRRRRSSRYSSAR